MYNPVSTYRVQFHKEFTFRDLMPLVPYLQKLGVRTLYASPILEAVSGSTHGYDAINPARINPEIGTEAEFRELAAALKAAGMGWIQDIVPNHMALDEKNPWLADVMQHGKGSRYAKHFDIDWEHPDFGGKLGLPTLGEPGEEEEAHVKRVYWKESTRRMNYRRFFTVNGLICLNIQDEEVFEEHHRYIARLVQEGLIQGLRIDHIDGLNDPVGYLKRLRRLVGPEVYITVEKILEPGEDLPADWPVQGNTGYDFLSMVNNVLTNVEGEAPLTALYEELTGDKEDLHMQLEEKKRVILYEHMGGELDNLTRRFLALPGFGGGDRETARRAIGAFLIACPLYRYYGYALPLEGEELEAVEGMIGVVEDKEGPEAAALLRRALVEAPAEGDTAYHEEAAAFYRRLMQFTGPLMAKGMEDTLMYTYNRLIGRNEVGDSPESFGSAPETFHRQMEARQQQWPLSLNGTATHDTKRGEDARARLAVLSDIPGEWAEAVRSWVGMNAELKTGGMPDARDEYAIYQSLAGHYPLEGESAEGFGERMEAWLQKALREGKRTSDWAEVNTEYEAAAAAFVRGLLREDRPFWKSFTAFHRRVSAAGVTNSLVQTVLKCTAPGVPDIYQGCEGWDFSFVDPDNRRAVEWERLKEGHPKQDLLIRLLEERAVRPEVWAEGDYVPLVVEGPAAGHVLAFARSARLTTYIVVVPLHSAALKDGDWGNTEVILPEGLLEVRHLFAKDSWEAPERLPVSALFSDVPVAVLKGKKGADGRGAGVLMHISSLPSPYATGDLGPEAYRFAEALLQGGQRCWQLLPINPADAAQGFSPYSALSSRAGFTALISPEVLQTEGLLEAADLREGRADSDGTADFAKALVIRERLLRKAYDRYRQSPPEGMQEAYAEFCRGEAAWLDDYALYTALRAEQGGKPWYEWPEELRQRTGLDDLKARLKEEMEIVRWGQFHFFRQWHRLRQWCNRRDLLLVGDLPIYVAYDSADVWSNQSLFALDEAGRPTGRAGVPPDAFSDDGQLWGMPVYRWDVMEESGYSWWIDRLKKNTELFDLVRLDHFRAFAGYWEVPAGEETARNGGWKKGPGAPFFETVKKALGSLPFVAEDLGDIDAPVIRLRDDLQLPGMNVLQFAFGGGMEKSIYIPHNYIHNSWVYTGTHDNNTTRGWFRTEADGTVKSNLEAYLGRPADEEGAAPALIHLAGSSVANMAVVPVQDWLNLDEGARMNRPGSGEGHWIWRLKLGYDHRGLAERMRRWTRLFNRL